MRSSRFFFIQIYHFESLIAPQKEKKTNNNSFDKRRNTNDDRSILTFSFHLKFAKSLITFPSLFLMRNEGYSV